MSQRVQATVASIETLSGDVRHIWFNFDSSFRPAFEAGGHLDFEIPTATQLITRSYSMVAVDPQGRISIAVKLVPQSRGGSQYMWTLGEGDTITAYTTRNTLPVTYDGKDYVLLAGGIGITPMIGIGRSLRAAGKSVRLIYCVRDTAQAPFVDELRREFGPALDIHDDMVSGMLNVEAMVSAVARDSFFYMCGPTPMMDAVNRSWRAHALPVDHLRFETFGTAGRFPAVGFSVEVAETGAKVQVAANQSMLDALLAAGQPTMFDCRKGECGLCKVKVIALDGTIDHRDVFLSDSEKADGSDMCCCVSRIYGSEVRIHIDAIMHGRQSRDHAPSP